MDNVSRRGAALVSVTWVVVMVILLLAAIAIAAVQMNNVSTLQQDKTTLATEKSRAEEAQKKAEDAILALSQQVGFQNPENRKSSSSLGAIKTTMERLGSMPEMTTEVKTLQDLMIRLEEVANQRANEISEKDAQRKRAMAEADEARTSGEKSNREKQTMLDDARKQLNDANDRAAAERGTLEQRIASLQQQNRDLDAQYRDYQSKAEKKDSDNRKYVALLNARIQEFSRKMAFTKEPLRPDGQILSMSDKLDLGYIDLGNKNRLRRGMRFDVMTADASAPERKKGRIEVVEVHPEYSEVRVLDMIDEFVPMNSGDLVSNPLFDPTGERKAVLIGRFSGRFSRSQLTALLADLNIKVQPAVDVTTDYLILGSEEIENGEPKPFSQNPEVKRAEQLGVVQLPMREIESFFAY